MAIVKEVGEGVKALKQQKKPKKNPEGDEMKMKQEEKGSTKDVGEPEERQSGNKKNKRRKKGKKTAEAMKKSPESVNGSQVVESTVKGTVSVEGDKSSQNKNKRRKRKRANSTATEGASPAKKALSADPANSQTKKKKKKKKKKKNLGLEEANGTVNVVQGANGDHAEDSGASSGIKKRANSGGSESGSPSKKGKGVTQEQGALKPQVDGSSESTAKKKKKNKNNKKKQQQQKDAGSGTNTVNVCALTAEPQSFQPVNDSSRDNAASGLKKKKKTSAGSEDDSPVKKAKVITPEQIESAVQEINFLESLTIKKDKKKKKKQQQDWENANESENLNLVKAERQSWEPINDSSTDSGTSSGKKKKRISSVCSENDSPLKKAKSITPEQEELEIQGDICQSPTKKKEKKKKQQKKCENGNESENLNSVNEEMGNKHRVVEDSATKKEETLNSKLDVILDEVSEDLESKKSQKKKNKSPVDVGKTDLNSFYSKPANKNEIKKHWMEDGLPLKKENGMEIIKKPFTCGYLPNFLENPKFLKGIKEELQEIKPLKKNNDLYKFTQTPDLKSSKKPNISSLREFLYGDFRKWLTEVTGIQLNDKVDMGSSTYEYTDVLLCHDDELEGRRIAYILYLVPAWEESDGGTLDLFNTDKNGQPKKIVRSLVPQWNTFAFFEVSPISFHQVAEVLSKDKKRLSINGWFHGPPIERPPKYEEPPRPVLPPSDIDEDELYSWINPSYLDEKTQKTIRRKFREDSEIELESFLSEEKYEEVTKAIRSGSLKWHQTTPANKSSYEMLKEKNQPDIVKECLTFLRSEAMFLILSQLTGLNLHKLAPPDSEPDSDEEEKDPNPRVRTSVRKWSHGSYTLIRDCDSEEQESALDANLFLNVSDKWTDALGGYNSYISRDEDTELLTVLPRSNCFALVYRDAETLRFTKYVNAGVSELKKEERHFFDFYCKYYE